MVTQEKKDMKKILLLLEDYDGALVEASFMMNQD